MLLAEFKVADGSLFAARILRSLSGFGVCAEAAAVARRACERGSGAGASYAIASLDLVGELQQSIVARAMRYLACRYWFWTTGV